MWTLLHAQSIIPHSLPPRIPSIPSLTYVVTACQAQGQVLVLDIVLPVLRSVAVVSATQDTAVLQLVSITQDSVTKQN